MGTQDSQDYSDYWVNKRNQSPIGIFDILSDNHFWGHFMTCIDHPRIIAWNWCEMEINIWQKRPPHIGIDMN